MSDYDAVVVGLGVAGSATARRLARDGRDVLALERGGLPNPRATSHGAGRIFRLAYHEGDRYVPLLRYSRAAWTDLAERTGRDLLRTTGSLAVGPPDSDTFAGARATCRTHGIDHEVLDAAAVNDAFPAYDLPEGLRAVYQPDGGLLDAERCLLALLDEARAAGADVRACEPVVDWTADGDRARVRTPRGTYAADAIVIATGAWAAEGVAELEGLLTRQRHVACRFRSPRREAFRPDAFPVFVADALDGGHCYGHPVHRVPGFKVGATDAGPTGVDPDTVDRRPALAEEGPARAFAERHLVGAGPTMDLSACVLTHSPDGDYVIDRLPDRPNAVVAVGLSGHGFKTAPAIGAVAAALATGEDPPVDAAPFGLDRFDR